MARRICRIATIVIVMLTTVYAYAQNTPSGQWWRSPEVVKQLQITNGEVAQLDKAFEASRIKMVELKGRLEAEQFKLQTMMKKGSADDGAIKAQHGRLEKARTALADERFAFFVQARKIIGHERFQQLLDMAPEKK